MDSRRGKSRGKSNRPLKRSLRRAVAWLLAFCMCMANMNSAAFAAEIATASNALMAATPSDAKATDSNAMEILMPEEVISGEDLAAEAVRAISEGNEFDFDSEIQVKKDDQGKKEGYEELFQGRRSFVLFADNGNGGRIQGDNPNAYGYILVQVDEKDYEAFEKEAGEAKATDSNATDSDAPERSWTLTGEEQVVFLYVNADDGSVTFTLNIENLQADDIVVPSYSELREEQKAEEEESREESEANNPAAQPAEDGSENGGSAGGSGSGSGSGSAGSSDSADAEEPEKGTEDAAQAGDSDDGQGSESGTEAGAEDSTDGAGQGSGDTGNSDSSDGSGDADKPDDSDGGQNSGQDAGNSAEDGNGSQSGSGSDTGSGDTDSGNAEGSGDAGSQKPDSGNSSDTGNGSDKGDSGNADKGDSDRGDSGSSSFDKGSSDKGNSSSDKGNSSSSDKGSSSSGKGGSSDTAKLSKSSYDVPVVMGPNPNAEFESDEYGDMSFDEWQEMMEEAEEEEEEEVDYEDYIEETALTYEDGDGTTYFGMSMLPAVSATVKKTEKTSGIARLFRKTRSVETEAVVMAGTVRLGDLVEGINGARKFITYLSGDEYKLHLDVSGGGQPLDILLVIDTSGSMTTDNDEILHADKYNKGNIGAVKKILGYKKWNPNFFIGGSWGETYDGFVDQVLDQTQSMPEENKNRFAIVSYNTEAKIALNWTSNETAIKETIGKLKADGGTNYEDGLVKARDILEKSDPGRLKYVIFLSDGEPTYYNVSVDTFGDGRIMGGGSYTDDGTDKGTRTAAKAFRAEPAVSGSTIYSIGIGNFEKKYLRLIANGTETDDTNVFTGGTEELKNTFDTIFDSLELQNVVITDQLSQYVDLSEAQFPNDSVRVYKTNNATGREETLQKGQYSLSYSTETKQITLDLAKAEENGYLDKNYTYSVEFNIKVNQAAKDEFAQNGYPTDTEGNPILGGPDTGETSAAKPGFPSNELAKVTWEKNRTGYTYPVPVVQVKEEPNVEYHKRAIQSTEDKEIYDLTLDVTGISPAGGGIVTTTVPTDIVFVLDESGSMSDKLDNNIRRDTVVNQAMEYILSDETGVFKYSNEQKNNIKVKGYIFSDDTQDAPEGNSWYTSSKEAISGLHLNAPLRGGTYPRGALSRAINAFRGSSAKLKYIIYLTDGEPSRENSTTGGLNVLSKANGAGIKMYPISINDAPKDSWNGVNKTYMEQVRDAAQKGGMTCSQVYEGTTADQIKQVFKEVTDSITDEMEQAGSGMTNVVIQDQLSDWAEFANPNITANDFVVTKNGTLLTEGTDYTVDLKNIEEKQFSIRFSKPLDNGAEYKVSVEIKPSQQAKEYYSNYKMYPHTPGLGTGTHENEQGFYSNTEATLSFTYDGVEYTGDNAYEYPHPVIQVPETGRFTVQKIVEGKDGNDGQKFIINIDQMIDGEPVTFSSVALENDQISAAVPVNGTQTFKISEAVPMEYSFNTIKVFDNNAEGGPKEVTGNKYQNGVLTVSSGDDLTVQVINSFGHKGYFHSKTQVTNYTTGDSNTPFTSSPGKQAAEDMATAELAKGKVEIEQEEGDLSA